MMLTPSDTLEFLDILEKSGFNDDHLKIVHFKEGETINAHRSYAKSIGAYRDGGRNMVVCQRLQYIVNHINSITASGSFTKLSSEAAKQFPMPGSK